MNTLNIINKDILTVEKGIIVQQVNAIGKTGAGLSGAINTKYPNVRELYLKIKELDGLQMGNVIWSKPTKNLFIASIVGQQNVGTYKVQTNFDALRKGLQEVARIVKNGHEVFIPYYLGSGLGGGPTQQTKQETWEKVSNIIWEEIPDAIICRKV